MNTIFRILSQHGLLIGTTCLFAYTSEAGAAAHCHLQFAEVDFASTTDGQVTRHGGKAKPGPYLAKPYLFSVRRGILVFL